MIPGDYNIAVRNALLLLAFFSFRLILATPALKDPDLALRINPDASLYQGLGVNMARHDAFSGVSSPPYGPEGLRTPLYPLLVAVSDRFAGDPIRPVLVLQALLWALMGIGLLVFTEKRYGMVAGLTSAILMLISPLSLKYGPSLMSENLFAPVLVAGALVFFRAREKGSLRLFALAGLLIGLSALVRPSSLALGVILALLVGRPLLKRGAVFAGLWLAPVGMWVIRNWLTFGFPFFSTIFSLNLTFQHAPMVIASAEGIPLDEAEKRVDQDLRNRYGADETWAYDPEKLNIMLPYGFEVVRNHPVEYAKLYLKGSLMCFGPSDPGSLGMSLGLWEEVPSSPFALINQAMVNPARARELLGRAMRDMGPVGGLLLALILAHTIALYAMALVGAVRLRRDRVLLGVCLLSIAALVLIVGVSGSPRFRLPAEPCLALLAGGAFLSRRASS